MSKLISPDDLQAWLAGAMPPVVFDVRGRNEFDRGHIPGAVHLPIDDLARSLDRVPTDRPVVLY